MEHADRAVAAAVHEAVVLRRTTPRTRAAHLAAAARRLDADAVALVRALVDEVGMPIDHARMEAAEAVAIVRACADAAASLDPQATGGAWDDPVAPARVLRRGVPRGPVFAMPTPQAPLASLALRLGACLAAGCPAVAAVPAHAPGAALLLGAALGATEGTGALARAVSVLPCRSDVLDALVTDRRFATLLVGRGGRLVSRARTGRREVVVEPGEQHDVLLGPDADVVDAAARIAARAWSWAGQASAGIQRILVPRDRLVPARDALAAAIAGLQPRDPSLPGTVCGPMADPWRAARYDSWLHAALGVGARAVAQGCAPDAPVGARTRLPVLLEAELRPEVHGASGPAVVLHPVRSTEEALALLGRDAGSPHAVGVFTRSAARLFQTLDRLDGTVLVHDDHPGTAGGVAGGGTPRPSHDIRTPTRLRGERPEVLIASLLDVRTLVYGRAVPVDVRVA
ncbi:MAG: Sulfoacetaldehyde dehydrogenase [Pseudomonadota bacterium]|jgi:acyl-CoA reductase-like NAD-dependent aldehyde dehydrogenase